MEAVQNKAPAGRARPIPAPAAVLARSVVSTGRPAIQCALRVSSPGDATEREAEATARAIVRGAPPVHFTPRAPGADVRPASRARQGFRSPYISRFAPAIGLAAGPGAGATVPPGVASEIGASGGSGAQLPDGVRSFMEPRFRANLGQVRVHVGEKAASLSRGLNARAFTVGRDIFFGKDTFQPERDEGRELIAHELTHTIQQGAVVQRCAEATVSQRSGPEVQRFGIGDALDRFASLANNIPGFRMFTIVLGVNPINMSGVDRSPANIMRAIVEFLPGGGLITQALDAHGVFDKVASWVAQQIASLGMVGSAIKQAITAFLNSLSWKDIFDLGGVWERAKSILTDPIGRLIGFAKGLVGSIIDFIKQAILMPIAALAQGTRGYDLLCAVLGTDPVTGKAVPQTAATLIGGFMKLIGQEEVWENMQRARAADRAYAWFKGAMSAVLGMVQQIPTLFLNAFKALEIVDIVLVPRAFMKLAGVFGGFIGGFFSWAAGAVWNLLEIVFDCVSPGALGYIKKTGAALKSILKNPLPFVGNLVRAAKLGFTNFAANFLTHLKAGLLDWLTGSLPGVYIPKALTLPEIVKFVFSVLGLTWANVRQKLVKAVGETAVKAMEVGFDIVVTLVTQGPAAAWDKIKDQLANLKDMVIAGITDLAVDAVVTKAVPKLIAMFIPGAGFISAIISIYDTVMVFVQKIAKIIQVVTAFINSIVAIAAGQIGAAAARVESILAGLLSLAISFLAGFAGLGNVASKIMGVVQKIRAPIDKALDGLINWIVTMARKIGRFVAQAGVPSDPNERLRLAAGAATSAARALGRGVTRPLLQPVFAGIQVRYGLRQIDAFERGGRWWVRVSVNPDIERNMGIIVVTTAGAAQPPSALEPMPQESIEFRCNTRKYIPSVFDQQLKGQEAGLNAISVPDWLQNRRNYDKSGRGSAVPQEEARATYRRDLEAQGKTPTEIEATLERLAALHEPDLVAGGFNVISKLGSRYINSSIGSQWRTNVTRLESAVGRIPEEDRPTKRINVLLTTVQFSP